jgi:hypothetical protein
MTTRRDPDSIVAAWLDEGPTTLPSATRRAILTALPVTGRASGSRWRLDLPSHGKWVRPALVVAATAIAVTMGLSLLNRSGVGPPPSPTAPPPTPTAASTTSTDTSTWTSFNSTRHGIAFGVPPGWAITAATAPWLWQPADPGPSTGATDRAVGPQNEGLVVASQRLPDGMTDDAWWTDYLAADTSGMPPGCFPKTRAEYQPVEVDGYPGYLHGGLASCNFTEVVVLVDQRAYQLTGYANVSAPSGRLFDPAVFDAWLSTVTFHPAAADDTPVRPST